MKNKVLLILITLFFNKPILAENIFIESKNILLDKNKETSIFKNDVNVVTQAKTEISSNYAEYNKKQGILILKDSIVAEDIKGNQLKTNFAKYNETSKILETIGPTEILTNNNYIIKGENITLDDNKKIIKSDKKSSIIDKDKNKIFLDNFHYDSKNNIFKSIGSVKVEDINNNTHYFSQIYIDTKKGEIIGSDSKTFFNDNNFKVNDNNKPRIFSNSLEIKKNSKTFNKSVFTLCDYREGDKCPPWKIQSSKTLHDEKKKTIYYDNAVIKVYNIPIFYSPKLSHPDPTVDRRSGFLTPILTGSKNLGSGITVPYFFDVNDDKNLTITSKLFSKEYPLFLGEYHQVFKNSNLFTDFGYTKGFRKKTKKKTPGENGHLFAKFKKKFQTNNKSEKSLSIEMQNVSDDSYLNTYKVISNLVDYNENVLENNINYSYTNEDVFFGFSSSVYETLYAKDSNKYEYVLPELTYETNLISNDRIGNIDLTSNYRVNQFETNKYTGFLINDLNWNLGENNFSSGLQGKFLGHFRNLNYETKNTELYKKDATSEIFGALGYLSELNLAKRVNDTFYKLKPKILFRYAPGSMRKDLHGERLTADAAFKIDRLSNTEIFETGLSSTFGFDYNVKKNNSTFDFSVAQILNEKENKKMSSVSSLDEKLSDVVANSNLKLNENFELSYNFSLDQNYNELNYSSLGTTLNFNPIKINFNYLLESKHIGNQEYFTSNIQYSNSEKSLLSFEQKKSLITDSTEFYNLSYEYINDCLRAGLVYRREFYQDSEIEPESSLMFRITLTPLGNIYSPTFAN